MNRKSLIIALGGYLLWGLQALFWQLLDGVDSMVVLACRILFPAAIALIILLCQGRLPELGRLFADRKRFLWTLLAALLVTGNWGLYTWLVSNGHYVDVALAYYINPLLSICMGILLFHEKCHKTDLAAILLAAAGVLLSAVRFGKVPVYSLIVALLFASYGAVKKRIHGEVVVSLAAETLLMSPVAIAYVLLSPGGQVVLAALTLPKLLLLAGAGPMTALPLLLYTRGINDLPLSTMGILQFLSPTLQLLVGVVALGEPFTQDKILLVCFIVAALLVYSVGLVRRERKKAAL